jgi:ABC-2 type transport system permease protein
MDKLIVVIKREFMERIRNKWFIIITLMMPVFLAAIILLPAWLMLRTAASNDLNRIIILDASGFGLGQSILGNLKLDSTATRKQDSIAPYKPVIRVVAPAALAAAEDSATAEIRKLHSYVGYLSLKDSTLINGEAHYAGRNASSLADMERLQSALRQSAMVTRLSREGVRPEVVKEIAKFRTEISTERISEKGKTGSAVAAIGVGFFLAFILYMSIMMHGQNAMRGVLEEKMTRVAEIVISSVKPDTLLAGKVLGIGAVGLLQQIAWFGLSAAAVFFLMPLVTHGMAIPKAGDTLKVAADTAAAAAAAAATPPTMAALGLFTWQLAFTVLGFFLTGFIFYVSLYAAAGSMVNSEQEAQQAAMPVIMLLVFTIIFLNPVMANSNGTLAVTLSWLPFSSPIIMPTRMALGSVPMTHVIGSWLISAIASIGAVWVAARIYRVGMLMYGKKPSFPELLKWIRYAG